jgi:ribosomal protein L37E
MHKITIEKRSKSKGVTYGIKCLHKGRSYKLTLNPHDYTGKPIFCIACGMPLSLFYRECFETTAKQLPIPVENCPVCGTMSFETDEQCPECGFPKTDWRSKPEIMANKAGIKNGSK